VETEIVFLIHGVKLEVMKIDWVFDGVFSLIFFFASHGLINTEKLKV